MPRKPRLFTDEEIRQVKKLAPVLNREQLADFFEMHVNTFDNIRERQPEVDVAYKKGRAETIANIGESLIQDALDGDSASRFFYLKTQAGWRETQQVDHTSSDGTMSPKPAVNLTNLSDEELAQLERLTDKARNQQGMGEA